jgi:peptidoglycan/xylan/chitin deacetylase (PgdA/CDA1 family)
MSSSLGSHQRRFFPSRFLSVEHKIDMLKKLKQTALASLKGSGVFTRVYNSQWRRQRLLILAYHGISLDDEHLWDRGQFMSREVFSARLKLLRKSGCTVLPLTESLRRLYAGDLPDKCVAITFDDGTYDFYRQACPLLREFGYPATLYLTTFYSQFNRPVFDLAGSYILWKAREKTLDLKTVTGRDERFNLGSAQARAAAFENIREFAREGKLSAEDKDQLAASLAESLGVDYDALLAKRMLQLVRPDEVRNLAADGIEVQLHTHRHRTPLNRELFLREIEDNRNSIREMTGTSPSHFCYPSGVWNRAFLPWLREAGMVSATTCELGLASPKSNPLLLPRLIDVSSLSPIEFEGWLTGIAVALPRR